VGAFSPVSLKYDQGLNVIILHVPVYDKRLSKDEGGWSDEDEKNELEELQTERLIFFLFKRINM
jgi:hypothetical protein